MKNSVFGLLKFSTLFFIGLLLSISSCRNMEDCEKNYTLAGHITDQSNTPLADVKVRWHYADSSTPEAVLGYTDTSGNYSIQYKTRSSLRGTTIEFVKSGFTTQVAPSYSESEAGSDLCGNLTLTRNATLAP